MSIQKIVTQFPKLTRVRVLDHENGYFLQSVETLEILRIPFTLAAQMTQYIHSNYLIYVFEVLEWVDDEQKGITS